MLSEMSKFFSRSRSLRDLAMKGRKRDEGKKLGMELRIGDLVVVELSHESEAFMIGVVTKAWHRHEGADVEVPHMGTVKRNDELVQVRNFGRCSGGRGKIKYPCIYELCDGDAKEFPVFTCTDDCRLVLDRSDFRGRYPLTTRTAGSRYRARRSS